MTPGSVLPDLPVGARILIIRLRSIGDIVLLTPALELLKQWRADLRVSILIESRFREIVEGHPGADELIELRAGAGWQKFPSQARLVREVRRRGFSLCLNLHGGPTSSFLTRLSGARYKVGFYHFRDRGFYDFLVPDARTILEQPALHTAEHQAAGLFWLGLPRASVPPARIVVNDRHRAWWWTKRRALGLDRAQKYSMIHPAALYPTKQWDPEKFARAGEFLKQAKGILPVYSCGPGEAWVLDAIEQAAAGFIHRLEDTTLGEYAAALAEATIFIGNDSGPAHMAGALGRPRVVIFGSSSSSIWGPWPRESVGSTARVVQNPYLCNPCPGDRCYEYPQPECIRSITLEQVIRAIESVLDRSKPCMEIQPV